MIHTRTLVVLIVLALLAVGGIFLSGGEQPPRGGTPGESPLAGEKVFPGLTDKANDVAQVAITSGAEKTVIKKENDQWVLPDRANYPADVAKVRQLILGLSDLKRVEPKTRNPELFSQLGVDDPKPGITESRAVALSDASGSNQAALVVGKEKPAAGTTRRSEYYIRVSGEDQAWLAEGSVPIPAGANDWLNTQLININQSRLASLTVRHGDGETVRIEKASQDAQDFAVVEPKREDKLRSTFTVNNMAQSMAQLVLQDVIAKDDHSLGEPLHFSATVTTFDGLSVTLDVAKDGEDYVAGLSANATVPSQPAVTEAKDADAAIPSADPTNDARVINERAAKWLFKLSPFAVESIGKRAQDLFEQAPAPELEGNPAP